MTKKIIGKARAQKLLVANDIGLPWKHRKEPVTCAADTGDSGWRETFNNGEQDIVCVEYPNARYISKGYALIWKQKKYKPYQTKNSALK